MKITLLPSEAIAKPTPSKRLTKKPESATKPESVVKAFPEASVKIGDTNIDQRLDMANKNQDTGIKADAYYLANREKFIGFITRTYSSYKKEMENTDSVATCEKNDDAPFSPMAHQKIVRDYMSKFSPYRGILLFHGLGAGKTCSSIAIAEGLKTNRQVIVMTPASLRMNYIEELKNAVTIFTRKINTGNLSITIMIRKSSTSFLASFHCQPISYREMVARGWLMSKPPNFESLSTKNKKDVDIQINMMISQKYKFINYNGLRKAALATLSMNGQINPFDNKVVVIDEAHNFVSRIVNKLGRKDTLSGDLYEFIMSAKNARIVLLSGTPIINYPNEIAILFNMLRGYIQTWSFKLSAENKEKITKQYFEDMFNNKTKSGAVMDYIEYMPNSTTLRVTRNPFGFVNVSKNQKHVGVKQSTRGEMSDNEFKVSILSTLKKDKNISVVKNGVSTMSHKPLPDDLKSFKALFIDEKEKVKNMNCCLSVESLVCPHTFGMWNPLCLATTKRIISVLLRLV